MEKIIKISVSQYTDDFSPVNKYLEDGWTVKFMVSCVPSEGQHKATSQVVIVLQKPNN